MNKREQIIVVITALVVLYGGYTMFFDSFSKKKKKSRKGIQITDLQTYVNDLSEKITTDDFSDKDAYIINKATALWEKDPFSKLDLPDESGANSGDEQKTNFSYSGYIQIGDELLAIINGLEYNVGEELGQPGYVVYSISPEKVIVRVSNRKMIALPLEDTM